MISDNIMDNQDIMNNQDVMNNQNIMNNKNIKQLTWTNNLTKLKAFIDLNERRPNKNKEIEKVMYSWVNTQLANRKTKKDIMSNENIRGLWDNFIKDYEQYFLSNKELWTIKLDELKSFIDLNKRRPLEKKKIEKVLTSWLSTQIKNRKTEKQIMLNEDIRNVWDNFIKDYNQYFLSNEELWTNNLTELKTFIDLNKRRPTKGKDTEKIMGAWMDAQLGNRKKRKYNMINENIRGLWDSFIKDHKQYIMSNKKLWTNNLDNLKSFIDLNERRPNRSKETEKVMGAWMDTQLGNRKERKYIMINEDIRNTWNSFIKDYQQYIMSNEELWINNLDNLKSFIDLNERRPNKSKKTEKIMAAWLSKQLTNRKAENQIMNNEDIIGLWDGFIKDYQQYLLSNEEL